MKILRGVAAVAAVVLAGCFDYSGFPAKDPDGGLRDSAVDAARDAPADGTVLDDGAPGEACADAGVQPRKRVFVTADTFKGLLTVGEADGRDGADRRCSDAAKDAGLPGDWRAWLSVEGDDPEDRAPGHALSDDCARYELVDSTVVAENSAHLTRAEMPPRDLFHAIDMNELGTTDIGAISRVWTGTDPYADTLGASGHCSGWAQNTGAGSGFTGNATSVGRAWTFDEDGDLLCNAEAHLYCFEQ